MKKSTMAALIICILMSALGAFAQDWAPQGVDMGGSRTPIPMPRGVMISDVYPEYSASLPQGYYLNDAEYDGQAIILLYRDAAAGGQEILMSVVQDDKNPHALNYVEGSFEESGEMFLYFMLINGQTLHGSLFLFSIEDNRMNLVLEEPCSNNMVLFEQAPAEIEGLGWVLWKDYILPIDLSDGSSYEVAAVNIEMLGGMPEISDDFFHQQDVKNETKYTYLTPVKDHLLKLTTVERNNAHDEEGKTTEQVYDCIEMKLVKP